MRTALDTSPDTLDDGEQKCVASVRKHGWFCTSVHGEAGYPGFSYTTGLWLSTGKPEFILFGMPGSIAYDVLSDLFHISREGRDLPTGTRTNEVFANLPAYAFPVAKRYYPDHLGWCGWFYDSGNFPCLQIVWPDRAGVFPWEAGFDKAFAKDQVDLTENGWLAALSN
jgi:hypothetical protein